MSDNLRRYRAICHALTQAYPTPPTGHFARHLHTLAALISGIVAGKSTPLPRVTIAAANGLEVACDLIELAFDRSRTDEDAPAPQRAYTNGASVRGWEPASG